MKYNKNSDQILVYGLKTKLAKDFNFSIPKTEIPKERFDGITFVRCKMWNHRDGVLQGQLALGYK